MLHIAFADGPVNQLKPRQTGDAGEADAIGEGMATHGGVAEWLKAAVLKTVERKFRGFESYLLRQKYRFKVPCSRFKVGSIESMNLEP